MKVIQVGIGGMGDTWLQTVLASPEVEYAALVEINDATAQAQAARYNLDPAIIYHTLDQALANVSAGGVIDVTPPQFHRQVAETAMRAGIPVLSEKPLADTLEAAMAIVRTSNETGVLHMVAQNRRYGIPILTAKQVLQSGILGKIGAVNVEFYKSPHFGGFRDTMPYPLIIDMAIHQFDLMRYFLNSDATSVFGRSWNPAWSWFEGDASAALLLNFGGIPVAFEGSWCATGVTTAWNGHWRFDCEHGVLLLRDDQVFVQMRQVESPQEGKDFYETTFAELTLIEPARPQYANQAALLHEFYQAVTSGHKPGTICQDNLQSLAIVFSAIRSFQTGNNVRVAEMLKGI
ncbi:MAG: Gfo/Idh/MocA family oxidoreductase [Anaerolineae bacterium]|nr:Gfo/Idh/MocA family oxidoreductase [Anaerolineae bacterium]